MSYQQKSMQNVRNIISGNIDITQNYSLVVDESSDRFHKQAVTNIAYTSDVHDHPILIE